MASIERTAYPRFKRHPTSQELVDVYTPTPAEIAFAEATARGDGSVLHLLIMLKAFQRLGYFPQPPAVPEPVIQHIRACLELPGDVVPTFPLRSRYRHQQAIRQYLGIRSEGKHVRHVATRAIYQAAQVMDNPADLINVAIEELIKERCELPAFSTLDRLARRVGRPSQSGGSGSCTH